jgi:PAS domain S-box-containing protein
MEEVRAYRHERPCSLISFTAFCDASPDAVILKLDEEICQINKPFKTLFGIGQVDDRYDIRKLLRVVYPSYSGVVEKIWSKMTVNPTNNRGIFLKERIGTNGHFRAQVSVFDVPTDGQKLVCAVIQDLSAYYNLKLRLKQTETRYQKLVEISGDIIYVHNKGKIEYINTAGARLLGADNPNQIRGRPFIDFVHPDHREVVLQRFRDLTRDKIEVHGAENKIVRLDGSILDVEVFGTPCMYRNKPAVQVILRDVSGRKNTEQALQTTSRELRNLLNSIQSLREKERMSIAREIHDELGSALTVLKYDIAWLLKRIRSKSSDAVAKEKEVLARIDGIIGKVRKISTALRPGILDNLGIGATIEWQAKEFQKHFGISCDVRLRPRALVLERELSTTIFRIFQETLTNVLRHARATRCQVELVKLDNQVVLKVFDNGRGVRKKEVQDPNSIGFIGIRERVEYWGGKLKIHGVNGKGTAVLIAIPLPDQQEIQS